jgi:hypothetical protein
MVVATRKMNKKSKQKGQTKKMLLENKKKRN